MGLADLQALSLEEPCCWSVTLMFLLSEAASDSCQQVPYRMDGWPGGHVFTLLRVWIAYLAWLLRTGEAFYLVTYQGLKTQSQNNWLLNKLAVH